MITLSTLFILLYSYSVYKIRKDSESWKDFNPFSSNIFAYAVFMFGTGILIIGVLVFAVYMATHNIIP
jgi:cytochrome c oxidase assembly factor CtaG